MHELKGKWVNELPVVLWAYLMISQTSTNKISFNLAFSIEVVIPIKVKLLIVRMKNFVKETNLDRLRTNLDLLEETQDQAYLKMVTYGQESPDTMTHM